MTSTRPKRTQSDALRHSALQPTTAMRLAPSKYAPRPLGKWAATRVNRAWIVAVTVCLGIAAAGCTGAATAARSRPSVASASAGPTADNKVRAETITIEDPTFGPLRFDALVAGVPAEARQGKLVFFLHGFPETADSFRAIVPAVARAGYFAVAFSQRGYSPGARPLAVNAYNVLDLVGDVTRIAASLGAPTFHLVGHDWGGAVAWLTAALHPDLVSSLTVQSTPNPDALSAGIADARNPQHAASGYMTGLRAPGSQSRILSKGFEGFKTLFALAGVSGLAEWADSV
jgi:pimeloyl-ACP methyl ester carboxylesterase